MNAASAVFFMLLVRWELTDLGCKTGGLSILLANHAAENFRHIFHDCLVHRNTCVKAEALGEGTVEHVVGVSAGCTEVVGDNTVNAIFIKRFTVDGLDGDTR